MKNLIPEQIREDFERAVPIDGYSSAVKSLRNRLILRYGKGWWYQNKRAVLDQCNHNRDGKEGTGELSDRPRD